LGFELVGRAARAAAFAGVLLVLGACVPICGIGAKFSLTNARVDAEYKCPYPSTDAPYEVHGSIDADNSTTSTVTIKSMTEADELVNTVGDWNGAKGAKGGGPITDYQPKSVGSGQTATIKFTVPFQCTNSGPSVTTYGEFSFKFTLVTSSGTYTVDAGNRHRLAFASS
jgi:hypothetical protein